MTKLLICCPIIINTDVAREALNTVVNKAEATVLCLNNGGGAEIEQLFSEYRYFPNTIFWKNETNVYVTAAWQSFIDYFLEHSEYSHIFIMNSDVLLQKNWYDVVKTVWEHHDEAVLVPKLVDDKNLINQDVGTGIANATNLREGIPGVCFSLTQAQAKLVSPLPPEVLVWFQDSWIFSLLIEAGYKVMTPDNFVGYHHWSTSVGSVPGVHAVIESDKIAWENIVYPRLLEKIKTLKQ